MFLLAFFLFTGMQMLQAQKQVSGTIKSSDDGNAIPGVTIQVKGTSTGTVTSLDGKYSINIAKDDDVLIFSFMGMETQEIKVGSQTTINVSMKSASTDIEGVEISALGLKRQKDKSANSSTKVTAELLGNSGESGVISSMAGKSSGLFITKNNGDPGSGSYIQIRGQSTISNSVQPLIVVDGVPLNNSSIGGGTDGVAQQSRFNDINPDDIESVEVLKGAAAAAIWGTRAANGVIMVTTKKGKLSSDGKSNTVVDFHSNFTWSVVNREYAKQDKYGQGTGGAYKENNGSSWGSKIADRTGTDVVADGPGDPWFTGYVTDKNYFGITDKQSKDVFNESNRDQVFRTGFASDIGASIAIVNKQSKLFMSVSDWNQQGVVRGSSDYRRSGLRVNYGTKITDKIDLKFNTYYAHVSSNRIQQGSNLNGLYLGYLRTSPDFDNTDYKGDYVSNGITHTNAHRSYRKSLGNAAPTYNNPGWTINEQVNTSNVDRFIFNPEMNFMLARNSRLTFRYGLDYSNDRRITMFPVNSAADMSSGSFSDDRITEMYNSIDLFSRTTHKINKDISFSWILGLQYNNESYNALGGTMTNFRYTEMPLYVFSNSGADTKSPYRSETHRATAGSYLVANFDLYNQFFIELTGRSEVASTYSDMIFYPSASFAWNFTKYIPKNDAFTFGKFRATYGTVGVQPPAYITSTQYVAHTITSGWGPNLDGSYYGTPIVESSVQGNANIEPERKTEIELGTDLRFVSNRIRFGFTFYSNKTTGAIFPVRVAPSTGFDSKWDNAAVISNTGIELDLNATVMQSKDFTWTTFVNFTRNRNLVEDLKGTKSIFLAGFTGTSSRAVEGEALGVLWGGKWKRDGNGDKILDANGFPMQDSEEGIIGDPNPDWFAGLGMGFNFKGIKVNFLFQHSHGGDMWAGTYGVLNHFGINPSTANEVTVSKDIKNYAGTVIPAGTTVRGNIEDFGGGDVLLDEKWYSSMGGGFGSVSEQFIVDATWTRLREVSIAYELPKKISQKLNLQFIEVGVSAQNVLLWTDFEGVDPELNLTGNGNGRGLDYFTNPGTKSFMFNLKFRF